MNFIKKKNDYLGFLNSPILYDSDSKVISLSWEDVNNGFEIIYKSLKNINFNKVLVMVRGGMVLSVLIAHKFSINNLDFFHASRNSSDKPHSYSDLKIFKGADIEKGEKVIIVEDIIFKGTSIDAAIRNVLKNKAHIAGICSLFVDELFDKNELRDIDKYKINLISAYKCKNLKWIRFPWEKAIDDEKPGKILPDQNNKLK